MTSEQADSRETDGDGRTDIRQGINHRLKLEIIRFKREVILFVISFVSSSLTTGISLLSLSDKSTVDVVGNLDVDYVTGPFCSLFFVRHFAV